MSADSTGWLAVVAFAVAGVMSLCVLFPTDLTFSSDVGAVVALVEDASPEQQPYRELALMLSRQLDVNNRRIAHLQWIFRAAAIALLAEALFWILFLAQS